LTKLSIISLVISCSLIEAFFSIISFDFHLTQVSTVGFNSSLIFLLCLSPLM
jgi:hypothetical protein